MRRTILRRMLGTAIVLVATSFTGSAAASTGAIVEPAGSISATSSSVSFEGSGVTVVCPVTLRGSLVEGPLFVERGETLGRVSEVSFGSCSGGEIERVLGLPWTIALQGALGTLPEAATGLRLSIQGFALNFGVFFGIVNCLYRGNLGVLVRLNSGDPYTTGTMSLLSEVRLPFVSGSGACPSEIHGTGTFTLTAQRVGLGRAPYWTIPKSTAFGNVRRGGTGTARVTLVNMSGAEVTIPAGELTIAGDQVFEAETGIRVRANTMGRIGVFFRPVAEGMFRGTIEWREGGVVIWQEGATGTGTP